MKKLFFLTCLLLISMAAFSQTFKEHMLGTLTYTSFFAALVFALIGVGISLLVHANTRNQVSTNTPVAFSTKFLLKDNWKRILLSFILIVITIRFLKELTGLELNMFFSLCVGLVYDKLSEFIKSKSDILKVNRPDQPQQNNTPQNPQP